jgi:hypothetical protein
MDGFTGKWFDFNKTFKAKGGANKAQGKMRSD